jgi:hypothetical protein
MRIDCGELDPGAVIRPALGECHPRMPERLDDEELADWRAGRNAVYQLAALTSFARSCASSDRVAAASDRPIAKSRLFIRPPRRRGRVPMVELPSQGRWRS